MTFFKDSSIINSASSNTMWDRYWDNQRDIKVWQEYKKENIVAEGGIITVFLYIYNKWNFNTSAFFDEIKVECKTSGNVSGRVTGLWGNPISGVTVKAGSISTTTNNTGWYLLTGISEWVIVTKNVVFL